MHCGIVKENSGEETQTQLTLCAPPPGAYWGLLNWGGVKCPNWESANSVLDFFLYHCAKRLTARSLQPHLLATQHDQTSRGTILPKPVPGVSASICSCWHHVWFSSKLPYEILVNSWVMWLLTWVWHCRSKRIQPLTLPTRACLCWKEPFPFGWQNWGPVGHPSTLSPMHLHLL